MSDPQVEMSAWPRPEPLKAYHVDYAIGPVDSTIVVDLADATLRPSTMPVAATDHRSAAERAIFLAIGMGEVAAQIGQIYVVAVRAEGSKEVRVFDVCFKPIATDRAMGGS